MYIFAVVLKEVCIQQCPGCHHRGKTRDESLLQKEYFLKKVLHEWADLFLPIASVEESMRWGYREKVCLNTRFLNNRWLFGFVVNEELIPIPQCPVHSNKVNRVIALLSELLPPFQSFPMAYYFQALSQLTLVLKTRNIPDLSWLTADVAMQLNQTGIEGLWIHLNPSAGRRMFEKTPFNLYWGNESSIDERGFRYGPVSFHQLQPSLYHLSLKETNEFFDIRNGDLVVDLYCGIGHSMGYWSSAGASIIGVESNGEAVKYALLNVPSAEVLRGSCRHRIPQLVNWTKQKEKHGNKKLLYLNPPRTGIEHSVYEWIRTTYMPDKIAYLSCSPGTLKRDIVLLSQAGFSVQMIRPYDFFPQTHHVECLVCLQKQG